jgi:hypothetical protein
MNERNYKNKFRYDFEQGKEGNKASHSQRTRSGRVLVFEFPPVGGIESAADGI